MTCSRRASSFTNSNISLRAPSPIGRQMIPSRLKLRRANNPQMCDMTPGWLRTISRSTAPSRIAASASLRSRSVDVISFTSNHVAIGAARWHHRVHILLRRNGNVDHAWPALRKRLRQGRDRIFDAGEIDACDVEAARNRNEISIGAKLGSVKTLAIEKLLLLADQPQPLVVEQDDFDVDVFFRGSRQFLDVH